MELEFSSQFLEKYSNMNFNENPSSESRVVPCGQTDGRGRRDITKLIFASCNFANCAGDKIEKNEMGWACGAYG